MEPRAVRTGMGEAAPHAGSPQAGIETRREWQSPGRHGGVHYRHPATAGGPPRAAKGAPTTRRALRRSPVCRSAATGPPQGRRRALHGCMTFGRTDGDVVHRPLQGSQLTSLFTEYFMEARLPSPACRADGIHPLRPPPHRLCQRPSAPPPRRRALAGRARASGGGEHSLRVAPREPPASAQPGHPQRSQRRPRDIPWPARLGDRRGAEAGRPWQPRRMPVMKTGQRVRKASRGGSG